MSHHQYYITTAIDYVNARPHLGHAYEKIATDVMARFQRLTGKEVFFLTGTDEHGSKVEKTARDKGVDPKEYTDDVSQYFKQAWEYLNITYNRFIRTTDPEHYALVEKMWNKLLEKGDIEKRSYEGNYCTGCEAFLNKRDLDDDGNCTIHQRPPEKVTEENYFFLLSNYKDQLIAHINKHPQFIQPDFRREEVLKMLEELQDISVSRPKSSVSWGIPVPNDPEQTIYVWIDALSNYITGIGCWDDDAQFNKFWGTSDHPNTTHVIGKDILRFHAIYWPAMLMSAELPLYEKLFVHGFINLNDAKISKSLGNVVSAQDLGAQYELENSDPIRYYLMAVTTFGNDGNFTEEDFKNRINVNLANNLGNLVNRSLNMTNKYFDGVVPSFEGLDTDTLYQTDADYLKKLTDDYNNLSEEKRQERWKDGYQFPTEDQNPKFLTEGLRSDDNFLNFDAFHNLIDDVRYKYDVFDFEFALYTTFAELITPVNLFIDDKQPWALAKNEETDRLAKVLYSVLERLRQAAIILSPVVPNLSANILNQLGYEVDSSGKEIKLNGKTLHWDDLYTALPAGQAINLTGPILPRLDSEIVGAAAKKK